ncbi:MAG: hypothetical protein R3F62_05190 [Planctomycetota bacterium]
MRGSWIVAGIVAWSAGATAQGRDKDPWLLWPELERGGISLWAPIEEGHFAGKYADALMRAAAVVEGAEGAPPAVVLDLYAQPDEEALLLGLAKGREATLTADGARVATATSPLTHLAGHGARYAFAAPPQGARELVFELPLGAGQDTRRIRIARLSQHLRDAEPHLQAWTQHATSDALRPISAIHPYLQCEGYREFMASEPSAVTVLLIRELAREPSEDALPRFLAWHALGQTPWGRANLEGQPGTPRDMQEALETWRERGVPGLPAECPGSSRKR